MKLARALVLSSRPLSWVNTAYPFAVAYFVTTGRIDVTLVIGALFFLVPYNALMYGVNDVFDYESDIRNPRKGGLEGAVLRPEFHRPVVWVSAMSCVPFVAYLSTVGSLHATAVLALSLFAVVAYSVKGLRFKERPFLDSVTSSFHFVSPALYGIIVTTGAVDGAALMLLTAFFLWGIASHAFGAVQDVVADRAAGLKSVATVIGARWTVRFAVTCYALAGALLAVSPGLAPWLSPLALMYILAIAPWWSVSDDNAEDANRGWRKFLILNFVAGACVTLALLEYVDM